ncbi:MAG: hypothetical protein ABIQ44_15505 [Chloroflexia bacterium]
MSSTDNKSDDTSDLKKPDDARNIADQLTDEQKNHAVQFLTTEHFTLQSARSATISDSSSRASLFMSTVSSSLIALAFVGQMSELGTAFNAFALVLFPTLFFVGLVTFERTIQSGIEDMVYASGINRIRHFYQELVPQTSKYFILSAHDDAKGTLTNMAAVPGWWQLFLTTASTIMIVNSVLMGVFVALLVHVLVSFDLIWIVILGLAVFVVTVTLHHMYQMKQWALSGERGKSIFPSESDQPQNKAEADH